jgi:hypothetical protein
MANAVLISIQAWLWCHVLLTIWYDAGGAASRLPALVVAAYIGLFTGFTQQGVLADVLKYTLVPLLLLATWQVPRTDGSVSRVQWTALAVVAGSLALLAHSHSVAFVAASAVLIGAKTAPRRRRWEAAIVAIVPLLVWTVVRQLMGQWGSHAMGLGVGQYDPGTYLIQIVLAAGSLLAPDRHGLPVLAAGAGLVLTTVMVRRHVGGEALRLAALFVGLSAAFTYALFNFVGVSDPIGERFLVFFPVTLVPLWVLTSARGPLAGLVVCSLLVVLPVLYWTGAAIWVRNTATREELGFPEGFAPRSARISSAYPQGPPARRQRGCSSLP